MVLSLAATPAQQCITHDQHTILVTESDASNADLGASSGRLVATGSAEGVERARLVDLVESGRLDGRAVAVMAGNDPGDVEFAQTARAVLAASKIRVVEPGRASVVLEPTLDVASVPLLTATTAAGRGRQPLDVYGFSPASDADLAQLQQVSGDDPARMLRTVNLFVYTSVSDPMYRADHSPNTFTEMCNQAYASALPKRASSTTTTLAPDAPLSCVVPPGCRRVPRAPDRGACRVRRRARCRSTGAGDRAPPAALPRRRRARWHAEGSPEPGGERTGDEDRAGGRAEPGAESLLQIDVDHHLNHRRRGVELELLGSGVGLGRRREGRQRTPGAERVGPRPLPRPSPPVVAALPVPIRTAGIAGARRPRTRRAATAVPRR